MKSRINENNYEITDDILDQMNDLRVTDGKIEDVLNTENGWAIVIDWLTYTCWKVEVMPVIAI